MRWPEVLERLEADALRIAAAADGPPDALEAAWEQSLRPELLAMPPLPPELVGRATEVLRVVADAEAVVAQRAATVKRGIDALAAAGEGTPPARYIDSAL